MWRGIACAARPPAGRVPIYDFAIYFLKEGLSAQADRWPEAFSPDFNRQET